MSSVNFCCLFLFKINFNVFHHVVFTAYVQPRSDDLLAGVIYPSVTPTHTLSAVFYGDGWILTKHGGIKHISQKLDVNVACK